MDSTTGRVLDQYQQTLHGRNDQSDHEDSMDDEEFLDLLEDAPDGYREQRMQELATQMDQARRNLAQGDYGKLTKVSEEEVFKITTEKDSSRVVVHFYHPNFKRCQVMSTKLSSMAKKHLKTRFVEIEAPEAPFLVTKLNIKVLPCVLGYIGGKESMRLVGFEQLGNSDSFEDQALQFQLFKAGLVDRADNSGFTKQQDILGFEKKRGIRSGKHYSDGEESD